MTTIEFLKMFLIMSGVAFWIILLGVSVKATYDDIKRMIINKTRNYDKQRGN